MPKHTIASLSALQLCLDFGIDVYGRRVYLHYPLETADESGEGAAEHVIKGLQYLDRSEGPIQFWINTPGGEITDMFAIYDVMRACHNEIHTIGFGEVCSSGALLLVGGDKRYATKHCLFMAHNCIGGVNPEGEITALESQIRAVRVSWNAWGEAMAKHTNHTANYWLKEMPNKKRELYLTATQMKQVQHGIIDDIWPVGEKDDDRRGTTVNQRRT